MVHLRISLLSALIFISVLIIAGCQSRSNEHDPLPVMRVDKKTGLVSWGYMGATYDSAGRLMPSGKYVIKSQFAAANTFSENLALVNIGGIGIDGSFVRGGEWAFIDTAGNIAISGFKGYASSFREGLAAVQFSDNGLRGYVDTNGVIVIPPQFIIADDFSEGLAVVQPTTNRYGEANEKREMGYINKKGEMVIKPQFLYAGPFNDGIANVVLGKDKSYAEGQINIYGELIDGQ